MSSITFIHKKFGKTLNVVNIRPEKWPQTTKLINKNHIYSLLYSHNPIFLFEKKLKNSKIKK